MAGDREAAAAAFEVIGTRERVFYNEFNRRVYAVCLSMFAEDLPVDIVSVAHRLEDNAERVALAEMTALVDSTAPHDVAGHARLLMQHWSRRKAHVALRQGLVDLESGTGPQAILETLSKRLQGLGSVPRTIPGVLASEVTTKPIRWLWKNYLALGKMTMFDADGGTGKSTITIDWAARITTGRAFPDGFTPPVFNGQRGGVVLVCAEDSAEDTVVPRLKAAGADLTQVHVIATIPTPDGGRANTQTPSRPTRNRTGRRECKRKTRGIRPNHVNAPREDGQPQRL